MPKRSLWSRIVGAIERAFGGGAEAPPEPVQPVQPSGPYEPEPPVYTGEEPVYSTEFDANAPIDYGDNDIPSGVPPEWERVWGPGELPETSTATDEYTYLIDEYAIDSDIHAQELLWDGWFDDTLSPDDRALAREQFFEYMGWDKDDFDWDDWRDWYEATAG